ncbi:hypothetical protein AAFX24_22215 [Vibrio mediterranei]|uniref:hypothetical protein n=1 Tax=Vibrio mediterranei TaxID=689 RepID=UPI0038CE2459
MKLKTLIYITLYASIQGCSTSHPTEAHYSKTDVEPIGRVIYSKTNVVKNSAINHSLITVDIVNEDGIFTIYQTTNCSNCNFRTSNGYSYSKKPQQAGIRTKIPLEQYYSFHSRHGKKIKEYIDNKITNDKSSIYCIDFKSSISKRQLNEVGRIVLCENG